jgi:Ca2+-binding EF-hand superfamily protein
MLQHDPKKRPAAAKALNDPWLNRLFDSDSQDAKAEEDAASLMDKVQATIQTFAGYGKLKKLALMLIAYKSTSEEIGFLRQMFDRFDVKHDGEVTLEEFKTVLEEYDYSDDELEFMFKAMDLDRTGVVHYSEFLAATFEAHGAISEEQIAECFDRLDSDDSG